MWTFIFSLRREDAERLGYNKAAAWQNLLKQESHSIAEAMRIPQEKFRWYAAYHDEGHHPHVHMMAWSADPQKGRLTPQGIAAMRSKMTNEIFRDEMTELYIRKDAAYKESIQNAKALLLERIQALETGAADDPGGGGLLRPMVAAEGRDRRLLRAEHTASPAANAAKGVSLS